MTSTTDPVETASAAVDGPAETAAARPWAAGHVIVAVVVALVVAALLNAQHLLATAERQSFGWQRDAAIAVIEPVAALGAAIGLDRPRGVIDMAIGRDDGREPEIDELPDGGVPPVIAAPDEERSLESDAPGAGDAPTDVEVTTPSPTPSETTGPMELERGPVTAADPLTLFIGGDSMVEIQFGIALEDLAGETGMIEIVGTEYDRGSGLTRPDFVDWPKRMAKVSAGLEPDIMVVYFGGNDAQPMELDGAVHDVADPEWQDEYRARVAGLMDQLADAGHHVYWMGLPVPRSDELAAKWTTLNAIYRSEAADREAITFVPTWRLFSGPGGGYSEYLVDDEGDEVDMRLDDGIHLTTNGAYRAARPAVAAIVDDFDIEPVADDDS